MSYTSHFVGIDIPNPPSISAFFSSSSPWPLPIPRKASLPSSPSWPQSRGSSGLSLSRQTVTSVSSFRPCRRPGFPSPRSTPNRLDSSQERAVSSPRPTGIDGFVLADYARRMDTKVLIAATVEQESLVDLGLTLQAVVAHDRAREEPSGSWPVKPTT